MNTLIDQNSDVLTTVVKCPSWCVARTDGTLDHSESFDGERRTLLHTGPSFGRFFVTLIADAETGQPIAANVVGSDVDDVEMDAASLRTLAEQALAAAQWLENVR